MGRGVAELLVDPIFHGWRRALRVTGYMQGWSAKDFYRRHLVSIEDCSICKLGEDRWDYFLRWESDMNRQGIKSLVSEKPMVQDGILYDDGRLYQDFQLMHIHTKINPHAILETTVKEVYKKMKIMKWLRKLLKKIVPGCLKCRLMEKQTLVFRLKKRPLY